MTKRRYLTQLPAVLQSQTLQKFFSATVDQVFQPGVTQSINAFVGRKPSYFDALKDFYKPEVNSERSFYQLEPAMTSRADDSGEFTDLLFYQDLVNNLRFRGANVSDHSRLFESEQYSWCPPIDVHKLTNFRDYYWLPDGPPVMVLDLPVNTFVGDGQTVTFTLPAEVPNSAPNLSVKVNNAPVSIASSTASTVTLTAAPSAGAIVKVWRNGNFLLNISGQEYKYPLPAKAYAKQTQPIEYTNLHEVITFPEVTLENAPQLERGMIVEIRDDQGTKQYQVFRTGTNEITLSKPRTTIYQKNPLHTVIDQWAGLGSQWSSRNHWYHKDLMFYSDANYNPLRATRPIIEFLDGVELENFKSGRRLASVKGFDSYTFDPRVYSGMTLVDLHWSNQSPSLKEGRWILEDSPVLSDEIVEIALESSGLQIEFEEYDSAHYVWDTENAYTGIHNAGGYSNYDNVGWEEDLRYRIETPDAPVQPNDLAYVEGGLDHYYDAATSKWKTDIQQFEAPYEPFFALYGKEGDKLGSTKIFSFTRGTGTSDSVLGFPLKRNSFGSILFTDHMSDEVNGLKGFKFYKLGDEFGNSWNAAGTSSQEKTGEHFNIPSNLQANPQNQNITEISANDWNEHFRELLAVNPKSWKQSSSAIDRSAGRKILQNRSALLRTMLMNSNANLDFTNACLYSEREYLRYRGKFTQALKTQAQQVGIVDTQVTLLRIMNQLKSAKTRDFPFSNNNVGGGEWFIPATAAYLGMTPLWKPEFVIDTNTAGSEILFIRGHDGSLIPGFARGTSDNPIDPQSNWDKRDDVLKALEDKIYHSAAEGLKTSRRPAFDIMGAIPGKFRSKEYFNTIDVDYSREEYLNVARPLFERWVSASMLNYRENKAFDSSNPFTWNYSSCKDVYGEKVPGHWRGIYKWYFDTDRPHQSPWEMLGFTSMPEWWTTYYPGNPDAPARDWGNAVKRNALENAVMTGRVSDPSEQDEFDPLFARPEFNRFKPVDNSGNLLDPITAGIVVDEGVNDYQADWEFGDHGPIESGWWYSHAASFTLAQLGYLLKPARFIESNWSLLGEELVHGQWIRTATGDRSIAKDALVHHELNNNKQPTQALGLQTWLADYIRSQGLDVATVLGNRVRTLGANLGHKLGGFIDSASLKVFMENSGLMPQEDVKVALYRSPSVREEFYGGVIVERTSKGWRVLGYDVLDPTFKILPVSETGKRSVVKLNQVDDSSADWLANTYYPVGVLIHYSGINYRAVKTHTSASKFEPEYWKAESKGRSSPANRATWYMDHEQEIQTVTYGTEFYSRQDIANFLSGYQAYLESRGWKFDNYNADLNTVNDFKYSVLEFLSWSMGDWAPGAFITLSPSATGVKFKTEHGTVQNVEQLVNGVYSVVDRQGLAISKNLVTANRLEDEITVGVTEGGIFGLRLFVSEVEQAIVFNNRTIFNDVIYDPMFDLRQARVRVIANISEGWKGRLDAPGFIITDNRLVPSFEQQVEDIRHMYDIEHAINLPLRDNARHQVGYQSRPYLENFMYNEVNQFEFYQGMIQQKGAPGVYSKLLRNSGLTQTRSLNFLEEWAFRKDVYGGVDKDLVYEFLLPKDDIKSEPQLITSVGHYDYFVYDVAAWDPVDSNGLSDADSKEDKVITLVRNADAMDERWIVPPKQKHMFPSDHTFTRQKASLPTAGYARVTETTFQALNIRTLDESIKSSFNEPSIGDRIWLYDTGEERTWNVFSVCGVTASNSEIQEFELSPETAGQLRFTMDGPVLANVGDILYITKVINDTEEISGFYPAMAVDGNTFSIDTTSAADKLFADGEEKPQVFMLKSVRVRFTEPSTILNNTTLVANSLGLHGGIVWNDGDTLYVDVCYDALHQHKLENTQRRWAVYTYKNGQFVQTRIQPANIRSSAIKDVKLFETTAVRTARSLNAKPLLNSNIVVWDPTEGVVPGVAQKEITYKLEYDPASYNAGIGALESNGSTWGAAEVGRLWWDLSTTRYLIAETDSIIEIESAEREKAELAYRQSQWGKVAPGASVDIWEWVKSSVLPSDWQEKFEQGDDPQVYDGEVLNRENASYVESQEWNARLNKYHPVYYFWVKNRKSTPRVEHRKVSAATVSAMLTNPASQGISWIAPITQDHLLLSGASQFLTPTSSVQITVAQMEKDVKRHVEWEIMRAGDEGSLPHVSLWNKMITSLTTRDVWGNVVPSDDRYVTDKVGFDVERGQTLFRDTRAARKHVVQYLNTLFTQHAIVENRRQPDVLNTSESPTNDFLWAQRGGSYYAKPMPHRSFWQGRKGNSFKQSMGEQLVYGLREGNAFYNVMGSNGDSLAMFDVEVATMDNLPSFASSANGTRVKVLNTNNSGFWSVWEKKTGNSAWTLLQVQRYDSQDCWSYTDWYAEGFDPSKEPTMVFANAIERDFALGENPQITLVKLDDGSSNWSWTQYANGKWNVVAKQNATIQLSDAIWSNTGNILELSGLTPQQLAEIDLVSAVKSRDRGYELNYILNTLRELILTELEVNQMFFSLVNYVHTEQDFVDWCFKTSYMYVTGYSDRLQQDPVSYVDLTDNLLQYINEVKPYHVKVRDFISKYKATDEELYVSVSDFDMPSYVDLTTGTIRTLDPDVPADLAILQTGRYVNWTSKWMPLYTQMKALRSMPTVTLADRNQLALSTKELSEMVEASPVRKIAVTQSYDDVANVTVNETLTMDISRIDLPSLVIHNYDLQISAENVQYPVDIETFDFQAYANNPVNHVGAENWDEMEFDTAFVGSNDLYAMRSIVAEANETYMGSVVGTLYGVIEFWGENAFDVTWDGVQYAVSAGVEGWFDNVTVVEYGYGLPNPRVISMRQVGTNNTDEVQILHVAPETNVVYRLAINCTMANQTGSKWVPTSTAAPLDKPL